MAAPCRSGSPPRAPGVSRCSMTETRIRDVAVFSFGPMAPPAATIRIRLAGSQNVIAVAEMADGTFRKASRAIAVTVGGCA